MQNSCPQSDLHSAQLELLSTLGLSDRRTLPPRTSSPIIMHPAVCINRLLFSAAVTDVMMLLPNDGRETAENMWT